jgi:hypothetical protein
MARRAFAAIAALFLSGVAIAGTPQYGTAQEARAMLDKAVAAVRADKAKALDAFNSGEGGFKDRDLYVFCSNASDGVTTAHPVDKGALLQERKDAKGFAFGQAIMATAKEAPSARSPICGRGQAPTCL